MRNLNVAAAQLGPIQKSDDRKSVVTRLIELLRDAHSKKAELVVFPELALTTFFPRWFVDDITEADHWYETEMPSAITKPLFDEAKKLGVGFCLGYAELTQSGERFNTQILVERDGRVVAKYRNPIARFNMPSAITSLPATRVSKSGQHLTDESA